MAAKLLHSLADENPDLQRQIGCMAGIFQLFDRHHILTGKRINQKRLPPANSHSSNGGLERQSSNIYHQRTVTEINLNKGVNEKQRLSTESSRASFSSSCSSSISSLECNKTNQQEASFDRIIFPETPSRDHVMNQSSSSPQLGRQSLDLRDVVKDSMYREARGLAVKTANKEETAGRIVKHRDSPRPLQLSKPMDGSNGVGVSKKQNMPADLKESLRVLAKLREAPWYYNERGDHLGSLYEVNDGSWHTIPKDAPRFSYDGRETNRLSFETRDTFRSTPKLKELPRLSLDSRECSMRRSNSDSKRTHLSRNVQNSGYSNEKAPNVQQSLGTQKRPPSVVAKLMGLEALPDSALANDGQFDMIKTSPVKDVDPYQKSLKINNLSQPIRISNTRNSIKDPMSPRWKNPDLVMKPVSSSRFPIEPAPWTMQDGSRSSQRPNSRPVKVPARATNTIPSVYSEIEKRLKDLEFKQSGKDLRALKQILEAMQAKGLLETRKEEQNLNFGTQGEYESECISPSLNVRSISQRNQQSNRNNASIVGGSDSLRTFESPIVIMKPAKLVEKASIPSSSVIPVDGISDLCKPQNGRNIDGRKGSTNRQAPKDQSLKYSRRDSATSSVEKRASSRNIRSTQSSTRSHQPSKEDTPANVAKSTGSVSPRLQQKKLEMEKQSRPPTPPSDSNRTRRQSNKQPTDSVSPGGKARPKCANLQQCDDELSEISNELRALSCRGDEISVQSDSNILLETKIDMEVTSAARSTEIDDIQSSSMKADEFLASDSMRNKSAARLDEEESFAELDTVVPEHPSPVSVLDNSAYRDDAPSPVKQISNVLKGDDGVQDSNDCQSADNTFSDSIGSGLTSEINRKKLQNIENLVQKLRRLNSNHDEARTDYIASLCENTNPDHRYISEILLASGLLLRDLGSGLTTFQLHPSGHPINPELFFVLEQTKASSLPKEECSPGKVKEKVHRKLIFDAVNEILVGKLALVGVSSEPWLKPEKLAKKTLNAQKLLKELCFEIEQFETKRLGPSLEVEEDGLKNILWEDVMHKSGSWTDFHGEIPGIVLHVEKLIFKDLVDEIVIGEAANLRTKPCRRRQLFAK
ncbi:protein LONGIFOLIA 1 [Ziziphus jujuba]|uniref:Protein LONGIFOLIA 1 n=1 Tax=Ziziphus jujuba TaxID=326968 RepID=A0ABM3IJI6_ZIZJJ|nr:protein LONGIFOLIA 1 [Ziziphus jujuba]XP_048329776.2 protein LONGIFOLIA 1 [Ziziphus jujuba]